MAIPLLVPLIVGAATSVASAAAGAGVSATKNKKAADLVNQQKSQNKAWWNMKQAEDYTQRADVQAVLRKQKELLDEQYKQAKATNVVAGGTDEALAMQKEAANKTLADTTANIAGQSSAYKDSAEQRAMALDNQLTQQQVATLQGQANNVAQAGSQGVSAGLNLMGTAINKMES